MTRVVITGSHGVGKTSLCHALLDALRRQGITATLAPEPIRAIAREMAGRPLLERRLRMLTEHFRRLTLGNDKLCLYDRSLLDVLTYGHYAQSLHGEDAVSRLLDELVSELLNWYRREIDLFLYLPIEFDLPDNPDAPQIMATRGDMDMALRAAAKQHGIRLVEVRGDLDTRTQNALGEISRLIGAQ